MRVQDVIEILRNTTNKHVAMVAPNAAEAKLLFDRFLLSGHLPTNITTLNPAVIQFDDYKLEFITPAESYKSKATYFIIEFPDMIPGFEEMAIGGCAEDVLLSGEIT